MRVRPRARGLGWLGDRSAGLRPLVGGAVDDGVGEAAGAMEVVVTASRDWANVLGLRLVGGAPFGVLVLFEGEEKAGLGVLFGGVGA